MKAVVIKTKKKEFDITFVSTKTNQSLIEVKLKSEGEGEGKVFFYNYNFPGLNLNCDIVKEKEELAIHEVVCKFNLINQFGLDTGMVETFVTIKGSYKKKLTDEINTAGNFLVVERDKTKQIVFIGNDIYQDDKIIGTYDEISIESPTGTLKQIQVNNTMKQMICLSTEIKQGGHVWRTLTKRDNKYIELKSKDKRELEVLILFLIDNNYL